MSDLTVIDRGNHCEIQQGDAIAAEYVASRRLANLFAAAPELLAALRDALQVMGDWGDDGDPGWARTARAAIAKAEGRSE